MTARGAASHGYLGNEEAPFHGAKLLLMESRRLLTCLRDDFAHIPFPAHWDLPGGGREGAERPVDCALRELFEEFGLRLASERLSAHVFRSHQRPDMVSWLFAGRLVPAALVIPLAWIAWMLARGAVLGVYPYGFVAVGERGLGPVLVTLVMILAFGLVVALVLWGVDVLLGRRSTDAHAPVERAG